MTRWERMQLDVPSDFPVAELDAIHAQLSDTKPEVPQNDPSWSEWAGACNGIVYRFLAANEDGSALVGSLASDISPPMPERYEQERRLFAFFTEGLSCIECVYYGLYFAGCLIDPHQFDPARDKRQIVPALVVQSYEAAFPQDPLTVALREVHVAPETADWRDARNVLSHRASPGRHFSEPGPPGEAGWLGVQLSATLIQDRRDWLGEALNTILQPAVQFVQQRYV